MPSRFRFADDANCGDFTLLFCIGRLRNVQTHVLSCIFCFPCPRCRRRRGLQKVNRHCMFFGLDWFYFSLLSLWYTHTHYRIDIIMYSTHYLFSNWPKVFNEFSKSAPRTSSTCRFYNNMSRSLKVMGNHVM